MTTLEIILGIYSWWTIGFISIVIYYYSYSKRYNTLNMTKTILPSILGLGLTFIFILDVLINKKN